MNLNRLKVFGQTILDSVPLQQICSRAEMGRVVCDILHTLLREFAFAAVLCGARPTDVKNVYEHVASVELGSRMEWETEQDRDVLSLIKSEIEGARR